MVAICKIGISGLAGSGIASGSVVVHDASSRSVIVGMLLLVEVLVVVLLLVIV